MEVKGNDRLEFSINDVRRSVEEMRASNELNARNKQEFLEYIDTRLAPEWNTKEGQVAVEELRRFVEFRYGEYIDYLNDKINGIEERVIPALFDINNA